MIKILFIRDGNASLPEIDEYIKFFNKTNYFQAFDSSKIRNYKIKDFQVIWEFKGISRLKKNKNQILVHEYVSLSTGKFPKIKNFIKSKINCKPDFRVFLNQDVKEGFKFNSNADFFYRDMGIEGKFISQKKTAKQYDFVYIGAICKEREMDKFLKLFTSNDNGTLCLIGQVDDDIYNQFKEYQNLTFKGKIKHSEIPKIASKAKYGINFIPDKYPFNIQTSTKLLEYLALDLKVVTTDYKWVRDFEEKESCKFYKFNYKSNVFDKKEVEKFEYINNFNPEDFLWDKVIESSKIKDTILNKYK